MGFGTWSLQLRDSSGSSPDSLLIPVVKPGTKTLQMYILIRHNKVKEAEIAIRALTLFPPQAKRGWTSVAMSG